MPQTTLHEWARQQVQHLDVVSVSTPDPVFEQYNLVAVFDEAQPARELVVAWERIEPADGAVGTVAFGTAPDRPSELERPTGVDPEGVTQHAAARALEGGIPGAIVGAVVVALIVVALDGWSGVVIGAAVGGAAFGAIAGGFLAYARGTGWGAGYRHSFVDDDATSVVFASIHSDDPSCIDDALRAAEEAGARTYRVDATGHAKPAHVPGLS